MTCLAIRLTGNAMSGRVEVEMYRTEPKTDRKLIPFIHSSGFTDGSCDSSRINLSSEDIGVMAMSSGDKA